MSQRIRIVSENASGAPTRVHLIDGDTITELSCIKSIKYSIDTNRRPYGEWLQVSVELASAVEIDVPLEAVDIEVTP